MRFNLDFALEKDLVLGEDPDKYYKVIDIDRLNDVLGKEIAEFKSKAGSTPKALIVEGHLSHLCEGADKMIVLRLNPSSLKNRLEARDYAEKTLKLKRWLSVPLKLVNFMTMNSMK